MIDITPRKSQPIPPGVIVEGIDTDPNALADRVPVFERFEPSLSAFRSLGTVSARVHSEACGDLSRSLDNLRAIRVLRVKAQALGANGLIDLDCSVGGHPTRGPAAEAYEYLRQRENCVRYYGEEAMHLYSEEKVDLICSEIRDSPVIWFEPPQCSYTTDCSALAIRREAVAP